MSLVDSKFSPGSLLAEQEQEALLTEFYKSVSVTTYTNALQQATGTQKKIITVTADTDTTKNGKYFYEGIAGVLTNSNSGGTVSADNVTVANYAAMQAVPLPTVGFKAIQVLSDTVNMGGAEGLYQKWANGSIYQIAANKQ